jgi:ubiquitin carboxyl-terminal hydrolase 7
LVASEIQDGDIICFQRHLSEAEAAAIKQTNPTATLAAPHFYDFLLNRMFVTFTPKSLANLDVPNEDEAKFELALSKKDGYDALAHKVAEYLSTKNAAPIEPSHLRFTTTNIQTGKPRAIVKRQQGQTVNSILNGSTGYGGYTYAPTQAADHLFYEVLEMSLTDLEQRKTVRITYLTEGITKEQALDLLVHKQANFGAVLEALQSRVEPPLPDEILTQIRFFEVHNHKVYKILPLSHGVIALNEFMTVYAEQIPEEEQEMDKDKGDRLLNCMHFEKDPSKSHGVPFVFVMKEGEVFKETKERLSKRTGIKGKNLEKIRFAAIKGGQNYSRPNWIEDGKFRSGGGNLRRNLVY